MKKSYLVSCIMAFMVAGLIFLFFEETSKRKTVKLHKIDSTNSSKSYDDIKHVLTDKLSPETDDTTEIAVKSPYPEQSDRTIEVVFVLDTTGSMSGLIRTAKEKIWAIVNSLATAKPTPSIKLGLVGFRDKGDIYITKRTDLTDDIDAVYNELMSFQAQGGGDTPESVNQALNEAVTKLHWSKDKQTYCVIFLVGDSPPKMNYQDDVKYQETCKLAATNNIIINTIQCGRNISTTQIWKEIAKRRIHRYWKQDL